MDGTNTSTGTYNQAETYLYDDLGEQIDHGDRIGTTHAYTYDRLGRLTSDTMATIYGGPVDATVDELGYAYNDAGQMSTATSYNATGGSLNQVQMTYDGFGNLLTDAQSNSGNVFGGTPTVSYTYDASNGDRQTGITYPDTRTVNYNYSGGSGLDSIASRISSVRDASGNNLQAYTYLGLGTPVTFTDGNGVALSYLGTLGGTTGDAGDQYTGLDRFGRIIEQNWTGPYVSGPAVSPGVDQFAYGYDADGNVLYRNNITDTTNSTTNTTLAGESQLYSYDRLNRLTNFSTGTLSFSGGVASISGTPTATEGWNLDALGNWHNSSSGSTTTNRNNSGNNQVTTVGSATLDYDANGNTTKDQNGQEYVYDAWNRLVQVNNSSGTVIARYGYDALGRQITDTENSVTTDLYYSDNDQVVETAVAGTVTSENVWSPFYVDAMIEQDAPVAGNGSVDTGFGSNTSNHTTTTTTAGSAVGAAADGSDVLVAASSGSTIYLSWYTAEGQLDTAYGSGTGIVSLSGTGWTLKGPILVQSDGDIDLAVTTSAGGMQVAQLNADGSIDTGFGSSGLKSLSGLPATKALSLATNGDIVVGGLSSSTFTVAELNASTGSLDSSFNSSGTTSVTISGYSLAFEGMGVQSGGDIVIAGTYSHLVLGSYVGGVVLAALSSTGSLDTSFGTSGIENDSVAGIGGLGSLTITSGNAILLSSTSNGSGLVSGGFYLKEYNASGSVNTSFGSGGSSTAGTSISGQFQLLLVGVEANGQIVAGGAGYDGNFTLARFNSGGSLDTSFGSSGIETGAAVSQAEGMVTLPDGRTVMAGTPYSGSGIILQQFDTYITSQRLYPTYDADYNVISLTDSSGNVVERYSYDPYGNVTVLNPDGTTRGSGSVGSSYYGWDYLYQGLRYSVSTGTYVTETRVISPSLGRPLQEDPTGALYVNGPNNDQWELSNPIVGLDSSGLDDGKGGWQPGNGTGYSSPPPSGKYQFENPFLPSGSEQPAPAPATKQYAHRTGRNFRFSLFLTMLILSEGAAGTPEEPMGSIPSIEPITPIEPTTPMEPAPPPTATPKPPCPLSQDPPPTQTAPNAGRGGPYGHLQDSPSVGPGKPFTQTQKGNILQQNAANNGGTLTDDQTGEPLVPSQQSQSGVTPPPNEAQVDHVYPKSEGGPNTYSNAEVRSRANNNAKSNKIGQ